MSNHHTVTIDAAIEYLNALLIADRAAVSLLLLSRQPASDSLEATPLCPVRRGDVSTFSAFGILSGLFGLAGDGRSRIVAEVPCVWDDSGDGAWVEGVEVSRFCLCDDDAEAV